MSSHSSIRSSVKSSLNVGERSSIFFSASHDKRNLWWRAFRKTVLEPYKIQLSESLCTEKVPHGLLKLVEQKSENLDRHAEQALRFSDAVATGQAFGATSEFPPDVVPAIPARCFSSRCLEPAFDQGTIPALPENSQIPPFDFPIPRPGLASGFSLEAFTKEELMEIPQWLSVVGTLSEYTSNQISPDQLVYSPYLLFERTYGNAEHELESSMNYCAMAGSAALNSINLLYDYVWPDEATRSASTPTVFSCIIDNELGIINHHWIADDRTFQAAPLCKFDFRDIEHFMYFLAWAEAIEDWANDFLLPEIRKALGILVERRAAGIGLAKALPSPVTDVEKQEKLSRSMKLAFDNIPWKGERFRKTPLGVTGAMRMRSPKVTAEPEPLVTPIQLSHPDLPVAKKEEAESTGVATTQEQLDLTSPVTVVARSPAPDAQIPPVPLNNVSKNYSRSTPTSPTTTSEKKKKGPPTSILSVKSAGLVRNRGPLMSPRSAISTEPQSNESTTSSSHTPPVVRPESSKSPPIVTSTIDMKSPSRSMLSISTKKSFISLRSNKNVRSPRTPEDNASPRERGFKSKISSGLGAIKEHAMPKRSRNDNSAPSAPGDYPLSTPAYDKKRFDIRPPVVPVPATPKFWADQQAQMVDLVAKEAAAAAYNANHALPFRQYTKSPAVATITTTTTAHGS